MKSIIQELQIEATNPKISVSDLLRKAKIVAVKLDLKDFADWIEKELTGYEVAKLDELPKYRVVSGEPKAWNPYRGWQPILFGDIGAAEIMAERGVMQPVGELDDLAKTDSNTFVIDYSAAAKKQIMTAIDFETDVKFMIGRSAVTGILEGVRNLILDWALKLEKVGIIGEGISFSPEEKKKAQEANVIYNIGHIGNFAGAIGNVSDSATISVTQVNEISIQEVKALLQQIKAYSPSVDLGPQQSEDVSKITKILELEMAKKEPEQSKIKSALLSLKNIFEGVTGNVIAQGILLGIGKLISG